eukprot:CAMPEP_0172552714 /NCGR_PEP_ID=MMETSP1067-20121228/47082_1 /TAXON_ID=265564 ORGANISM="Thalassiosira punctigera, Strain Tpunct2005C2" /NCGR_SAMPLE_ID=MMETSP1067 /ASSEMBLY_ACC=CAM_ASM_000444 /LENGTH=58 /DNA_ID=CAMNT_0013340761 /DNA_START=37 /DNA_END=209 /DNA_ORIENTATION=+
MAPTLGSDSDFCPQIQLAEPVCCPSTEAIEVGSAATTETCLFCEDGLTQDAEYVIPGS